MAVSPLKLVREFFDTEKRPMTLVQMKAEWVPMPEKDKQEIIQGLTDGSLTY